MEQRWEGRVKRELIKADVQKVEDGKEARVHERQGPAPKGSRVGRQRPSPNPISKERGATLSRAGAAWPVEGQPTRESGDPVRGKGLIYPGCDMRT
eukprot:6181360-Pleurochrysis_carterae.AAC.3